MRFLVIFVLAFSPGILWLWLIYKRDKYRPEPRALVIRTFLWGAVVAIPVAIFESLINPGTLETPQVHQLSILNILYISFIVAGFSEELGKYLVVKKTIYGSPYFDEPMDGIVYSSAAALGFASLENFGYLLSFGWEAILLRGPFSTLGHVFFSAMWGYALGLHKAGRLRSKAFVYTGLIISMGAHGLFDFFLFLQSNSSIFVIPFFIAIGILFLGMLRHASRISPYKGKVGEMLVPCPACGAGVASYAGYCTACGSEFPAAGEINDGLCSKCGTTLGKNSEFCTACGSRITKKYEGRE
ncbi:MAG: PrsW family glutamic-type intramembrane protease [Dehalococcoidia bacterium]|nr:PrsW family glutamic-type intramembrane protease [Dehalococcoidia bacterium]